MEDNLRNLKKSMNQSILKDINFDEKHVKSILDGIKKSKRDKPEPKIFLAPLVSFMTISILFVGVGYFAGTKADIFNLISTSDLSPGSITEHKNNSIYTPPHQDEYFEDMTKEEILTKMLNSVDHFETAKGEFELYYSNSNTKINVEYELSIRENSGGVVTSVYEVNGKKDTRIYSYKDVYNPSPPLKIEDAFSININGEQVTDSRWSPPIQEASNSLFPYEIASNYTRNLSDWEIEKQDEKLLDHNTLVLKGNLNTYAAQKGGANSFRFWIDKDSGVLIKYETYDSSGKIVDYLHPLTLKINTSVNLDRFK